VLPPTISGLTPAEGSLSGGTSVTIKGTGFSTGASVRFGATAATVQDFVSSTELEVTSPGGTRTVDVTVTTDFGTSATGEQSTFTYIFIVERLAPTTDRSRTTRGISPGDADGLSHQPRRWSGGHLDPHLLAIGGRFEHLQVYGP
jgi:hypothetical protein